MSESMPSPFVRIPEHVQPETFCVGSLDMIPKLLVERFGKPFPGDGNRVSGEFIFADGNGTTFYIYDWKMTGEYNPALSPDEFWDLDDVVLLQIGGCSRDRTSLHRFLSWLDGVLTDGLQADQDWLGSLSAQSCSAEDQERLLQLLESGGSKTRIVALEAIRRIGQPIATPRLLKQLLSLLHLPQPIRPMALRVLSAFASLAHTSWLQSSVMEQLDSESVSTRCNGISALGDLGPGIWSDAVSARFAELLVEEPTVRHALLSMSWVSHRAPPPPTAEIVSHIALQLSNPDAEIRRHAARAVPALGKGAAVLDVLTTLFRMLGEANRSTRVSAEVSFERLGQIVAIPGFLSHLCQSVQSRDFPVQASALRVARRLAKTTGESEAGRHLARLITSARSHTE
ncbi:MAG TPA: hypothetical protein P5159_20215 [Phycisphaerae bacterium]|nr:hypothetical protein [Phycisphaerae bacterium]HSA28865.1 hypothetical protein [Phycisphaerae bacterium]